MTADQEFQVMKLVLDKFLWLGFIVMGWGMYNSLSNMMFLPGLYYMLVGAVMLVIFVVLITKEYEIIKRWK